MSKNRRDGIYIKPKDGIHAIMPYLMDKRIEAEVSCTSILDITELVKWVDNQNKKLDFKMTYFQALAGAFVKICYNREFLNRFVAGHRMYKRKWVSIAFVAKDKLTDKAEEKMIVLKADDKDNALTFAKKMAVDIFKTRKEGTNDLDKSLKILTSFPRWIMRIIIKALRILDYYGKVPRGLADTDSNYATILLSNLGSIKGTSCYHHLNNYGTNSILITIGTIYESKGRKYVDITTTLDERIADGFYFIKSIKLAQEMIDNPECLEDEFSNLYEGQDA